MIIKRTKFVLILFCMVLVIVNPFYAYSAIRASEQMKKTIVVGDDENYPPYSFMDKNGKPAGFDIELSKAVLEAMGYNVEFKLGNWSSIRSQLESGEVDLIPGMFYSKDREKMYDFSSRLTVANGDIFTRKGSGINDIKQLQNATVVVEKDEIMHEYLEAQALNIKFIEVASLEEALKLVSEGKYDYAAVLKIPGHYIINNLKIPDLVDNKINIAAADYSMAVKKGNEELLFAVNGGLKIVKTTGEYQKIYDKWLGVYEQKNAWDFLKRYSWIAAVAAAVVLFLIVVIFILRKIVASKTKELLIANEELQENQEELNASNEEMQAAYEQLAASEEELKAQYDEMHGYLARLENLKQKYQIAIQGTNSVIWEYNIKDETVYFSEEFRTIYDKSFKENENICNVLDKITYADDRENLVSNYREFIKGKNEEIYSSVRITGKDKSIQWLLVRGRGIYDENGTLEYINGIILDVTNFKRNEDYIKHLAYHDALTNLPNRIKLMEKLDNEIQMNHNGAVMLLDIDNFKAINDTLGHIYGDKILKRVADELFKIADEKVFVSRFGGDEFLVLVQNEKNIAAIEDYARKIISVFNKGINITGNQIYAGCSIGITVYPQDSTDSAQLVMNADVAMYKVKDQGKNNYMFYNNEMAARLKEKIEVERILREAVNEGGFKLLYQPQICIQTGEVTGFEALLRLKDHNISPSVFIQVAEESSMIIDIGRWVTHEVISKIAQWKREGLKIKPIAVNFSAKQMIDLNYIDYLKDLLNSENVESEYIEIEITESIFLENRDETIEFLNKLKSLGIEIALDDFGTGYSSLSYLTFIPVDKIKLDKSLCDKFLELENISVMDSIISLVHSLNLKVVAEGIEELEQYKRLRVGKCDYIQGYFFSRPLEEEQMKKLYFGA